MATQIGSNLATPLNVETIIDKKKAKQTDKLIKGIEKLEKRLTQDAKDAKAANGKFSWKGGIKGAMGAAKESLSDKFSLKGVAGMMGIKPDGMIGSMLEARHESKKAEKAAEQEKKLAIVKEKESIRKADPEGKLTEKEVAKKGLANYERKESAKKEIEKQEAEETAKETRRKELGILVKGGQATPEEITEHESITTERQSKRSARFGGVTPSKQSDAPKPAEEPIASETVTPVQVEPTAPETTYDRIKRNKKNSEKREAQDTKRTNALARKLEEKGNVSAQAVEAMEKKTGPMSDIAKGGMKEGIIEGIEEELLKLSKEQLSQLEKLVELNTVSEEDRLEKKATIVNPLTGEPKKNGEKDAGILGMLKLFNGGVLDFVKGITGFTKIMPFLTVLSNPVFLAGIAAIATLALIASDKEKTKADGSEETFAKKTTMGAAVSALDVSHEGQAIMDANKDENGQEVSADALRANQEAEKSVLADAPFLTRAYGYNRTEFLAGKGLKAKGQFGSGQVTITKLDGTSISKPSTPAVEASANQLEQTTKTNEDLTAQKEAADRAPAPSATIVNNNTTSNNSTTTTRVSPPVRPLDSTINNSMQSRFA